MKVIPGSRLANKLKEFHTLTKEVAEELLKECEFHRSHDKTYTEYDTESDDEEQFLLFYYITSALRIIQEANPWGTSFLKNKYKFRIEWMRLACLESMNESKKKESRKFKKNG